MVKPRRRSSKLISQKDTLNWLASQNLAGFRGLWLVAHNRRILAKAPTLEQALEEANLPPEVIPFVWKIPQEEQLVL